MIDVYALWFVIVWSAGDVGLSTDYLFDPRLLGALVKIDRSKKIAVIGDRHRRHFHFHRLIHQLSHPHRAIEERVFGVQMEVNERIAGHRASVFSEENFSQIYPAFHRNFSCAPISVIPSVASPARTEDLSEGD